MTINSRRIKLNHKRVARINSSYFSNPALRKRVYASSLATFAVKSFFEEQSIKIIEGEAYSDNFYILESLDLSDIKLNNARIDVRCSINNPFTQVWIPRKPYKLGYRFDFYVAVVLYPEKDKSEIAGYISFEEIKDIISADSQNENYFILDAQLLHPIEDLPAKLLNLINAESIPSEVSDLEHGVVEELFVNFLDNTLTSKELKYLENHLINCDECKEKLANLSLFDQKIKLSSDPRLFLQEDIPIPKGTTVFKEIQKEEILPDQQKEIPSITESALYETIEKPINPIETVFDTSLVDNTYTVADSITTRGIEGIEKTELQTPVYEETQIITTAPELQEDQLTTPVYEEAPELIVESQREEPEQNIFSTPIDEENTEPALIQEAEPEEPLEELTFTPVYEESTETIVSSEPEEALTFIPIDEESLEANTWSDTEEPEETVVVNQSYEENPEPGAIQDFNTLDDSDFSQIPYSETYEPPFNKELEEEDIYYEEPKSDNIDPSIPHYLDDNDNSTLSLPDSSFENKLQDVSMEDYDNDGLSLIPEYLISPTETSYEESIDLHVSKDSDFKEEVIQVETIVNDIKEINEIKTTDVEDIKPVGPIENDIQTIKTVHNDVNMYGDFAQSSITFSDNYENKTFEELDVPENTFNIEEDKQYTSEKVTRIEDYIKKHKPELQEEENKETNPVEMASKKRKKKLPIALVASFAVLAGVLVAGTVSVGLLTSKPVKDLIAINKQPTDELKDVIEQQSKGKSLSGAETSKAQSPSVVSNESKESYKKENPSLIADNSATKDDKKVQASKILPAQTKAAGAKPAGAKPAAVTQAESLPSVEKQHANTVKSNVVKAENTISTKQKALPSESQDKKLRGKVVLNKNILPSTTKALSHRETKVINPTKPQLKENKVTKQEPKVIKHITSVKQEGKEVKKNLSPVKQQNKVEIKQKISTKKLTTKTTTTVNKENTSNKNKNTSKRRKETLIAMNSPAPPMVARATALENKLDDEIVKPVTIGSASSAPLKGKIKPNNYDINTSGVIKSFKKDGKAQASYGASESKQTSKDLLASLSEKEEALKFNPNPVDVSVNDSVASANILWKPTSSTQIQGNLSSFVNGSVQRAKSSLNQAFKKNNISGQFQTVVILIKINNSKKTVTPIIASSSGSSRVDNIILSSIRKGFSAKSMPGCDGACDNIEIKLSIVM